MPPSKTADDSGASSGLLSNVFSFVSREIESFISAATGGAIDISTASQPTASSSRVKLSSNGTRHRERRAREGDKKGSRMGRSHSAREQRMKHAAQNSSLHKRKEVEYVKPSPRASLPATNTNGALEEELSATDRALSPSPPAPQPPPNSSRRRKSVSMPGSLFSPEMSPDPDWENVRVVRFASKAASPFKSRSASRNRPIFDVGDDVGCSQPDGRSSSSRRSPTPDYAEEVDGISPVRRPRGRSSTQPGTPFRSISSALHSTPSDTLDEDVSNTGPPDGVATDLLPLRRLDKGKQRAVDPQDAYESDAAKLMPPPKLTDRGKPQLPPRESAHEVRVRGKERELVAARNEQRQRENGRETDEREKERDKDRIKALEEEIERLKAELARRPSEFSSVGFPPPPPPPPPPPIGIRPSSALSPNSQTKILLSSARASLKQTAPPTENPINPSAYGSSANHGLHAKRTGRPTVNIGQENMAAFLDEVKTHKLRKVGSALEVNNSFTGSERSSNRSADVSDMSNGSFQMARAAFENGAASKIGEKRKRIATDASADAPPEHQIKRRPNFFHSRPRPVIPASSSTPSNSQGSTSFASKIPLPSARTMSNASSSSLPIPSTSTSQPVLPFARSLQSSSTAPTDFTTPSLCSDNDVELEAGLEDRPPLTPPVQTDALSNTSRSVSVNQAPEPEDQRQEQEPEPSVIDVDAAYVDNDVEMRPLPKEMPPPSRPEPAKPFRSKQFLQASTADMFRKRPPSSPIPPGSARKPKPPARQKPRSRVTEQESREHDGDDEDDDPLSMSYTTPVYDPDDNLSKGSRRSSLTSLRRGTPRKPSAGSSRNSLSIAKAAYRKRSGSSAGGSVRSSYAVASGSNTLEAELRRADELLEQEISQAQFAEHIDALEQEDHLDTHHSRDGDGEQLDDDYEYEEEVYMGMGTASKKRGFLAGGGAGGPPVFMGKGNVVGVESSDDEVPSQESERRIQTGRRRKASISDRMGSTAKRKGKKSKG